MNHSFMTVLMYNITKPIIYVDISKFLKKIALFQITWLNCPTPDQLLFFPFNCFIRIFRHFLKQFGHCVYAMPALILSLYLFWISKIKKITKLLFTYTPHSALIIRKKIHHRVRATQS